MINKSLLYSVFLHHNVSKVSYIKKDSCYIFLIEEMNSAIPLQRWEHLESILKDITKKEFCILPYKYAEKYLLINERDVIKL